MKSAVDFSDPRDVAAWLDALAHVISDIVDAGREATRRRRARMDSRRYLRSTLRKAARTTRDLLDAARRGLGPMPVTDPADLPRPPGDPAEVS